MYNLFSRYGVDEAVRKADPNLDNYIISNVKKRSLSVNQGNG